MTIKQLFALLLFCLAFLAYIGVAVALDTPKWGIVFLLFCLFAHVGEIVRSIRKFGIISVNEENQNERT